MFEINKKDLLDKIEKVYQCEKERPIKNQTINLSLSFRELRYVRWWIRTAYANDKFLDEDLDLK